MAKSDSPPPSPYRSALRRVVAWVRRVLARNFLLKMLSIGIAVLLWGMVREEQDVDDMAEINLKVLRPDDILFLDPVPNRVDVRLIGPRSRLRQAQQVKLEMTIDMSSVIPGENSFNVANYQIRNLPAGISTAAFHPSEIRLRVDHKDQKELRVRPSYTGEPATDYELTRVSAEPEVIVLEGAKTHLESIDRIATAPIDITDIREDRRIEVPLDYGDLYVWPQSKLDRVSVEIVVTQLREQRIFEAIPVTLVKGLPGVALATDHVKVEIEGPRSQVNALEADAIRAFVDASPDASGVTPPNARWGAEGDTNGATLTVRVPRHPEIRINAVEPSVINLIPPAPSPASGESPEAP